MEDTNYFLQKIRKKLLADAAEDVALDTLKFAKVSNDPALIAEYEKGETSKIINIQTLDGRAFSLNLNPHATVLCLKAVVGKKIAVVATDLRLIWGGKELKNEQTLEDYSIVSEATIYVVLHLPGGGCEERKTHLNNKIAEKVDDLIKNINMIPKYNRVYSADGKTERAGFTPTTWKGAYQRGGFPYFCPNGWIRLSIKVSEDDKDFDSKYGNWKLAYHGTKVAFLEQIIQDEKLNAAHVDRFQFPYPVVYFSPSIEYCAAERYAKPWLEDGKWWQLVFQVRLNPAIQMEVKQGTLPGAFSSCRARADVNFSNNELEWVVKRPADKEKMEWMRIYGIMLRVTDVHPSELPQCKWWQG